MLDRIDIHIEVPRVDYKKLSRDCLGELFVAIRERAHAARDRQFSCSEAQVTSNADMRAAEVRQFCKLDEMGESLMRSAMGSCSFRYADITGY